MNLFKKIFGKEKPLANTKTLTPVSIEEEFLRFMDVLKEHKRTAYVPVVAKNQNTFSDQSKIGGFPFLRNERDWPVCPNCNKNMQLFLQLNLQDLPVNKDKGLIQLFYCTTEVPHCESYMNSFLPFSEASNCRLIHPEGDSFIIDPIMDALFDEKTITGWDAQDDYPRYEEYERLGISVDLDVLDLMEKRDIGLTIGFDKLFGWPYSVLSEEYHDRKTGRQMEFLFQLGSEDNLPYMFGDMGIAHLTQSPDNKNELGFGWACS